MKELLFNIANIIDNTSFDALESLCSRKEISALRAGDENTFEKRGRKFLKKLIATLYDKYGDAGEFLWELEVNGIHAYELCDILDIDDVQEWCEENAYEVLAS